MKLALKQKVFSLKEAFTVLDEDGQPVYQVAGKLISLGHKLTISDMDGQEVGYVHQKLLALVPRYFIEADGQEELELKATSPCSNPTTLWTPPAASGRSGATSPSTSTR